MQPNDSNYHLPPFPAFPSPRRYVPLGSVQEAFGRVCRSIDASEAISLVIGPPGTGKTLLCGLIAQRYRKSHDVVVLGETRLEDRNAFLRHLLHHLKVDLGLVRDGDLQLAVIDRVCSDESAEGGLLIVVDEAQSLSTEVLEAIRMVTNIMHEGVPRVSAVVSGGVKLDDLLVEPSLEAFTQRVATRCYLHPFNGEETGEYIRETIRQCGADPDGTINQEAIATIHHACSGVPRLINQLMTQAIDCAEEVDQAMISNQIIDVAWAQLQQLPSPMVDEPRMVHDATDVEFGELDESESFSDAPKMSNADRPHAEPRHDASSCDDMIVDGASELWFDDRELEFENYREPFGLDLSETLDDVTTDESVFGDFELEEDIAIGSGLARPPRHAMESPTDLERALHQEIIGLNAFVNEALDQSIDADPPHDAAGSLEEDSFEPAAPEEVVEDFVPDEEEPRSEQAQPFQHQSPEQVTSFVVTTDSDDLSANEIDADEASQDDLRETSDSIYWITGEESVGEEIAAEKSEEVSTRDDSDLLVIEDEVEIRRIDVAKRYDSLDQTISVDFQAMLSRMRSGSKS